jgi:nucleoside phosphorylase
MARRIPPHFKAASGIESILLKPTEELINNLQKDARKQGADWEPPGDNESGRKSYNPSVMILDTFFSDESDKSILTEVCKNRDKFPSINILLVNPNSDFAKRQPSIERNGAIPHDKTVEGLINIVDVLGGVRENTRRNPGESVNQFIERLIKYIKELGTDRKLEVKFYNVYPRNPMYFFNDILVSGQFGVKKDCLELPWYKIIDDPICDHDLFDEYLDEFHYIWEEKSSDSIQPVTYNQDLNSHPVDIAIICALEEELKVVLNMGVISEDKWGKIEVENSKSLFFKTQIETAKKKHLSVVAARKAGQEMGSIVSASLTTEIIHRFQPKLILLVGIAAGKKSNEHSIGDILIAKQVVDYDSGKLTAKGHQRNSDSIDSNIDQLFDELNNYDDSLNQISKKALNRYKSEMEKLSLRAINIHPGKLLCGNKVIASDDVIEELKNNQRQFIGLEMESYGVYYAAKNASKNNPHFLCIKSISDFAGEQKDDSGRSIAKFTAAEFCYEFIVNHIDQLLSANIS